MLLLPTSFRLLGFGGMSDQEIKEGVQLLRGLMDTEMFY